MATTSGVDSAVLALRLQDCAETAEEKEAARAMLAASRAKIEGAIVRSGGSVESAAAELRTSDRTLYRLIERYDLRELAHSLRFRRDEP